MNQSKKSFHLMATVIVAAMFALIGCDDNSTEPNDPADALVGTWQSTSMVVYHGSSIADADSFDVITTEEFSEVLTLNADSTGSLIFTNSEGSTTTNWTYTATDTEITLTGTEAGGSGEPNVMVLAYELSGNTLTTTMYFEAIIDDQHNEPEGWVVTTLTKQ